MNGEAFGIASTVDGVDDGADGLFTAADLDADWISSSATKITLSDSGSTINGNGAYVYDGDVYIVYPGHYVLTGELTDGSVVVTASKTDKIWICLDAAALHCEDSAAIRIEQADKVFLTLADGTKSTISSGSQYDADIAASGVDGAIYSRDDLTINGSGALEVSAAYKHGIVCNDSLAITGGDITVSAAQDGIHANDSVRIRDAAITISAGDDGITVSNDDETASFYIASGSILIPSCYEGLEAADITIAGGTIGIAPTDDGINANGSGARSVIRITGGDIAIVNADGRDADGLDSNGSIYIEGGRVLISVSGAGSNCAIDYGSENGGECIISGGTVIACGGSTMAEGFDSSSTQGFLMYNTSAAAGTAITLADSAGRELLSAEIPCSFSSAVLSAPGMQVGDVCLVTIGDVQEQVTVDNSSASGFAAAGMFRGGMRNSGNEMAGGRGNRGGDFFTGQGDSPFDCSDRQLPEDMQPPDGMQPPEDQSDNSQSPSDQLSPDRGGGELSGQQNGGGKMFDRQNGFGNGGFPGETAGGTVPAPAGIDFGSLLLLAVSSIVLLAGIAIAFKFKR